MDVRPVPDDHERRFREVLSYAFSPTEGPGIDGDPEDPLEAFHPRAAYDARPGEQVDPGDLAACCGYYDFEARVRGSFHPLAGIGAVASPPEGRRRGGVSRLLAGVHRELREAGVPFAALWPFEYPFYRRQGYGVAGRRRTVDVPPEVLESVAPESAGRFRRLTADDIEAVREVHATWATEALAVRRTDEWWEHRVFASPRETDPWVYGWERDGDLRGYLAYRIEDPDGGGNRRLHAWELAAVDRASRDHLLRFCRDHDSQVESVRLRGPSTLDVLGALDDPGRAEVTVSAGAMVRLVDVPAALEGVDYPPGETARLTLAVEDGSCPWNDGRFALVVGNGSGTVERVGDTNGTRGPTDDGADASLRVGALSRLVVGGRSARALAADGALAADSGTLGALEALFPTRTVHLRERF